MKNRQTLKLRELTDCDFAVSASEGASIHDRLRELVGTEEKIFVDFEGMEILSTAFLNAVFGQLYRDYSVEQLDVIEIINISPTQSQLLDKVISTAKHYHADSDSFDRNAKKHFGK